MIDAPSQLRLAIVGSVDDGKSTLIGRLLFDSKQIYEDQLEHVEETSRRRGDGYVNLALLTDGLRAEREQGITIDVAHRYFATPHRRFVIADTPGHVQYTRNMVTGASTADLAVVLIDARKGVVEQTRRHAYIASLVGVRHLIACVNKMDLIGYDEERFDEVAESFRGFASKLEIPDVTLIPVSALNGDNVVDPSSAMPWYDGPPLLEFLEHVEVANDRNLDDVRFPVQYVIRPMSDEHHDYRGYAGQIASGVLGKGDEVVVLPSGLRTRVKKMDTFDGELEEAYAPQSVTVLLEDDLDISRGDMLVGAGELPETTRQLEATVCWMIDQPLTARGRYIVRHTTREVRAIVDEVVHKIDLHALVPDESATQLELNEIGRVSLRLSSPLVVDDYSRNRETGSFILIDEATNATVGAGMIATS
ncbi:MAG: bifunctional enzyme CysN/CysC [Thermoleophilaceae bacterium]|jgi:bifunctional enzyme CysN/CysC|nr:bifunctional enzyme CysN/CysC [Thermoleophilaceae bacterium]